MRIGASGVGRAGIFMPTTSNASPIIQNSDSMCATAAPSAPHAIARQKHGGAGVPLELHINYVPWFNHDKDAGQAIVHTSDAKFRIVCAGRQSGKTMVGISEICMDALEHPGHINWWVCVNLETKSTAWDALLAFLPSQVVSQTNKVERSIRLINGSQIWVKSAAGEKSLVSASLDFIVCDEAAGWKESAWERGVSPMIAAREEARVLMLSTPRGRNWFWKMYQKGRPGPHKEPEYESFHWKSEDSPYADQAYLIERKKNMPADLYAEEFEADPLDSAGGVFRNIRNCVIRRAVAADGFTCIGVDLGQKNDFTAIVPMNSRRQALSVERIQDEYPIQKQRVGALAFQMNARLVVDEANVGLSVVQDLRAAGFSVEAVPTNSAPVKRALIENLRVAFQNNTVAIPDDPVLIEELEAYTYEVLPSGQIRYSAPDGQHDDTVVALALALWGQRGSLYQYAQAAGPTTYAGTRGATYGRR